MDILNANKFDTDLRNYNYDQELKRCEGLGADINVLKQLKFDDLQLEEIRKGLESKIDVSS